MESDADELIGLMAERGYIVLASDGKWKMAKEPPLDEDPIVIAFWRYLWPEAQQRRFERAMGEDE